MSAADRAVRQLVNLKSTGASSRLLNLLAIWEKAADEPAWREAPFFMSPTLNRAIIVKHRPRRDEEDLFPAPKSSATKVILPINICDLRAGGRSFFVGQHGYEAILDEVSADPASRERDRTLLSLLDALPSLDPFLMRESLRKDKILPARCYFDVTEADLAKMFAFAKKEIAPLISLTFDDLDARNGAKVVKLVDKILNAADAADLEPLRKGMGLKTTEFQEGVFSWKGFLYYKWALIDLAPSLKPVCQEIMAVKCGATGTDQEKRYIAVAKGRLTKTMTRTCDIVRDTLQVYDDAYYKLSCKGEPTAFRDFLLDAPKLFHDLGERVGALQHIVSFWRYRFRDHPRCKIATEELFDIFSDFEQSLSFEHADA
jgi:hypothetical protein